MRLVRFAILVAGCLVLTRQAPAPFPPGEYPGRAALLDRAPVVAVIEVLGEAAVSEPRVRTDNPDEWRTAHLYFEDRSGPAFPPPPKTYRVRVVTLLKGETEEPLTEVAIHWIEYPACQDGCWRMTTPLDDGPAGRYLAFLNERERNLNGVAVTRYENLWCGGSIVPIDNEFLTDEIFRSRSAAEVTKILLGDFEIQIAINVALDHPGYGLMVGPYKSDVVWVDSEGNPVTRTTWFAPTGCGDPCPEWVDSIRYEILKEPPQSFLINLSHQYDPTNGTVD